MICRQAGRQVDRQRQAVSKMERAREEGKRRAERRVGMTDGATILVCAEAEKHASSTKQKRCCEVEEVLYLPVMLHPPKT